MAFSKKTHLRYWRMCANILPDAYQSSDASRMFLGFFIVSAFDLLDVPDNFSLNSPSITTEERRSWVKWIYSCQTPDGHGFRGFTGTDLQNRRTASNEQWDPGNLPNTFFALAALLVLGDDLSGVMRQDLLEWLPLLQRTDGSFGETLGAHNEVEGGRDLRYCCCAAGIAFILHDPRAEPADSAFNEDSLMDYILSCQNANGGFGESPLREPHSGLNYCAIATLELLSRLNGPASRRAKALLGDMDLCVRWLVDRQTTLVSEEEADSSNDEDSKEAEAMGANPARYPMYYSPPTRIVGFNGRPNKIADTCYCFWNSGALTILDSLQMADLSGAQNYLLMKVQHLIGGFAKGPGSPPDVLHSYLGLAALSLYGESGIKSLDPALCISREAVANLQYVPWRRQNSATGHPQRQ